MKLTAKQLKSLPDNEFGIIDNGKRSFPLCDEKHVRLAIQMFKYCPKGKEKELAGNINRKAKQYGLKMNIKGAFAKYADKDILGLAGEASNVGTLEPIVGAADSITFPVVDDDSNYGQKVLAAVAQKKIVAEAEFPLYKVRFNDKKLELDLTNPTETKFEPGIDHDKRKSQFSGFEKFVNDLAYNTELKNAIIYMTTPWSEYYSNHVAEKDLYRGNIGEKIQFLMQTDDTRSVHHRIYDLIASGDPNDLMYYLSVVYRNDNRHCTVLRNLIQLMSYKKTRPIYIKRVDDGEVFKPEFSGAQYDYKENVNFTDQEIVKIIEVLNLLESNGINFESKIADECYAFITGDSDLIEPELYDIGTDNKYKLAFIGASCMEVSRRCSGYYVLEYKNKYYLFFKTGGPAIVMAKYITGSTDFPIVDNFDSLYTLVGAFPIKGSFEFKEDIHKLHSFDNIDIGPQEPSWISRYMIEYVSCGIFPDMISKISHGVDFVHHNLKGYDQTLDVPTDLMERIDSTYNSIDDDVYKSLDDFINDNQDNTSMEDLIENMVVVFNAAWSEMSESLEKKTLPSAKFRKLKMCYEFFDKKIREFDPNFDFEEAYEAVNGSLVANMDKCKTVAKKHTLAALKKK